MQNKTSSLFKIKKNDCLKRKNFSQNEEHLFISSMLIETGMVNVSKALIYKKVASKTSIRNRCVLTGRAKSVFSKYRLSRLSFRQLALFGFIPGIRKAA